MIELYFANATRSAIHVLAAALVLAGSVLSYPIRAKSPACPGPAPQALSET
jgi:hypothetical protein